MRRKKRLFNRFEAIVRFIGIFFSSLPFPFFRTLDIGLLVLCSVLEILQLSLQQIPLLDSRTVS